jgi:hypothetical protein
VIYSLNFSDVKKSVLNVDKLVHATDPVNVSLSSVCTAALLVLAALVQSIRPNNGTSELCATTLIAFVCLT